MRLLTFLTVFLVFLTFAGQGLDAAEIHVKQDGTGDFTTIQAAIDAAVDGDAVIVHPGTYYENIQFKGKNIVLRSTAPEDKQIVASTIIDGGQKDSVVAFTGTEDETCLLSGFTITHGRSEYGGGIYGGTGTLAGISDCTISDNAATGEGAGGGLYACMGRISNCAISGNSAGYQGGGLCGSNETISNCTISNNSAGYQGGGLYFCEGAISNCTISGNSAPSGGGLDSCYGPISNCTISDNSATDGGGLSGCDVTISNCTISGNSADSEGGGLCGCGGTIANCTITDNSARTSGGGLDWCGGTISTCTITGNSGIWWGGGLAYCDGAITNCIVWANEAPNGPELYECGAAITYSCIRGWTGGGEGNISDDPLFVAGPLGDYYLSCRAAGQTADSPCIDAGNGTAESLGLDKLTTRTDAVPDAGVVDMGYHYPTTLQQNPQIECSLNASEFSPGDLLVGLIEAHNPGPGIAVDAYVAFVLPGGTILSLTSGGLTLGTCPWVSNVVLPTGLHFGPSEVFRTTVPDCPGSYLFAAALTEPGQFDFIGQPSISPFEVMGDRS